MPQRMWALLLLVAFVAVGASGTYSTKSIKLKKDGNSNQRQQMIKTVEKSLLDMFGLSSRPRPRRNITVSDYMWELYKKQAKFNRVFDGRPANTIRCFRAIEKENSKAHKANFQFDIDTLPKHESVWAAELVLYRRPVEPQTTSTHHRVQVFDVLRQDSEPVLRLLDTRVLRSRAYNGGWENFDVLPSLKRWRKEPSTNLGLVVELSTNKNKSDHHHVRLKREARESHEQWLEFQPLLVTYSRDNSIQESSSSKRTRRSAKKHRRKGRRNNCARHALYVDFSDVGWNDWIVAPPGYDAYFCHGDCPFPLADHLNATNHAIVQTLMNSVNPAAVPRACCVPTELSPISMLYVDEYEKVVLKNYQDMVVEGCGCR